MRIPIPISNNSWVSRFIAFFLAKRVLVQGWSMHPTLVPDERLLFDRLAYHDKEPQRSDIVLAVHPHQPGHLVIKRIVALPGEQVRLNREGCWVNGYVYSEAGFSQEADASERVWDLGPEDYFLLGDAPGHSTDSRHFGPLHLKTILGRAWLVYWPVSRFRSFSEERKP